MIEGWFYLHDNKELIYKNSSDAIIDIRESDLCHSAWGWDGTRQSAWTTLVEAHSLGANKERIKELSDKWKCDEKDAVNYAEYLGINIEEKDSKKIAYVNNYIGEGNSYLEAMSDLCKKLGYSGGKMWNHTFKSLIDNL